MAKNLQHEFLSDTVQQIINNKIKHVIQGHHVRVPYKIELDNSDNHPIYHKIISIQLGMGELLSEPHLQQITKDITFEISKFLVKYGWKLTSQSPKLRVHRDNNHPETHWIDLVYGLDPHNEYHH